MWTGIKRKLVYWVFTSHTKNQFCRSHMRVNHDLRLHHSTGRYPTLVRLHVAVTRSCMNFSFQLLDIMAENQTYGIGYGDNRLKCSYKPCGEIISSNIIMGRKVSAVGPVNLNSGFHVFSDLNKHQCAANIQNYVISFHPVRLTDIKICSTNRVFTN